jgi:hypothetical protein
MQSIDFKRIPEDAIVDLKMSARFYNTVVTALLAHSNITVDDLAKMLSELHTRSPETNQELITLILLELISGFEDGAEKQKLTISENISIDTISSQEDDHES